MTNVLNAFKAQHLCETAIDYRNGIFSGTDDVIEQITGTKPITIEAFVAAYKEAFATAAGR